MNIGQLEVPCLMGILMMKIIWASSRQDFQIRPDSVSHTHLRAHETVLDLVCRLLLEKKKIQHQDTGNPFNT